VLQPPEQSCNSLNLQFHVFQTPIFTTHTQL
jgi:hypothetical protein